MPSKTKAKVSKIGNGLAVFIPAAWCRGSGIEAGTIVELVYNGVLTVKPPKPKETVSAGVPTR